MKRGCLKPKLLTMWGKKGCSVYIHHVRRLILLLVFHSSERTSLCQLTTVINKAILHFFKTILVIWRTMGVIHLVLRHFRFIVQEIIEQRTSFLKNGCELNIFVMVNEFHYRPDQTRMRADESATLACVWPPTLIDSHALLSTLINSEQFWFKFGCNFSLRTW